MATKEMNELLGHALMVAWVDSAAMPGWRDIDASGPARIRSCGILMRCDPLSIVLAMGLSSGGRCHEQITIPRGCITSATALTDKPVVAPTLEEVGHG